MMEENVALDSSKQRKFVKSIKGIKKIIQRKNDPEKLPSEDKVKAGRVGKKKRKNERGLVYLSHIPHGFYEHEMTEYFKQFGGVTNARVIRSKRTGSSKGYAFVEFREPSVAQIVADTMNNYLMGKRLLKAAYIPPEKQRFARRMNWNSVNNPANKRRIQMKKVHNDDRDEKGELKRVKKILSTLSKTKKKLQELGINYDFFAPVDMPEALLNVKQENKDANKQSDSEKENEVKKVKQGQIKTEKVHEKSGKVEKKGKSVQETFKNVQEAKKAKGNGVVSKNDVQIEKPVISKKEKPEKSNNKQMKEQKQKLLTQGVTPLEEFIKVQSESESGDSDGSEAFDSDEFEKMMQNDDDFDSNDESDDGEDSVDDNENDTSTRAQLKNRGKPTPNTAQKRAPQKQKEIIPQKKAAGQKLKSVPQKFEKQVTQKPRNKQFKKKK